jgi:hypothetical protein
LIAKVRKESETDKKIDKKRRAFFHSPKKAGSEAFGLFGGSPTEM